MNSNNTTNKMNNNVNNFKRLLAGYNGLIQVNDTVCVYRNGNLVNPYDNTIHVIGSQIQRVKVSRVTDEYGFRTIFELYIGKTYEEANFASITVAFLGVARWNEKCLAFGDEIEVVEENYSKYTVVPTDFFVEHLKSTEMLIVDHENLATVDGDNNIVGNLHIIYGNVNDIERVICFVNGVYQLTFKGSKGCRMIQFATDLDDMPNAAFKSQCGY